MKTIKIFMLALAAVSLVACDKHDPFDDILITGEVGPQVYWTIGSSMVSAGSTMDFNAQYYTSVDGVEIDHSELWYNISETVEKTINCPWTSTFTYTITSLVTEEKRGAQKISEYPHSEEYYNDSLRAYNLIDVFPVSGTLSPYQWAKPAKFEAADSANIDTYFGVGFMQHFKDSLYTLMKYGDFSKMLLGLGVCEDMLAYTDSTYDANTDSYTRHFKWNADSTATPVPAEVKAMYDAIPFANLIQNTAEGCYDVTYKRNYKLKATLRVYDDRGVYGTTQAKDIDIN